MILTKTTTNTTAPTKNHPTNKTRPKIKTTNTAPLSKLKNSPTNLPNKSNNFQKHANKTSTQHQMIPEKYYKN